MELQAGFIIHRRHYLDSSLILEVFTKNLGIISVIARGAKRKTYRHKAAVQLFTPILLSWFGKNDLFTLKNIEISSNSYNIKPQNLSFGFYLNELLAKLIKHGDPHTELFDFYNYALVQLTEVNNNIDHILRVFEKKLLQELGYQLIFDNIIVENHYTFKDDAGFVAVDKIQAQAAGLLSYKGRSLLALEQEQLSDVNDDIKADLKKLMRSLIQQQLGTKTLKSREMVA